MNLKKMCGFCIGSFLSLCLAGCNSVKEPGNLPAGQDDITGPASSIVPELTAEPTKEAEPAADGDGAGDEVQVPEQELTREWFLNRTLEYAEKMAEGDFSVAEDFSDVLTKSLSEKDLKSAWKQIVRGLGEPAGFEPGEVVFTGNVTEADGVIQSFDGYLITTAGILYEKKGVNLTVTYNADCRIEGIYMTYVLLSAEAEETEAYTEIEVSIGEGDYPLDGLLTLPKGAVKPPVVLLVHGSGQSDMNETIGAAGNAPFADLAHGLAEHGIATLRYNKRYYQYPETAAEDITIYDEVLNDVSEAIRLLAASDEVDAGRIYVLGHSLGGMLAPYIVQENPQLAGMISLAGSPRKLWDVIYDQNMAAIESAELGESETEALKGLVREEYDKVLAVAAAVEEAKNTENMEISEKIDLSEAVFGVSGWYWASLAEIDTERIVSELEVPMLFLQGSADFQVYAGTDFAMWQQLLGERENTAFYLFEGLNHLFMESNGRMDETEYDVEAHVSGEVIDRIAGWILGN